MSLLLLLCFVVLLLLLFPHLSSSRIAANELLSSGGPSQERDGGVFRSGSESSGHIENSVDGGHVFDVVFGHIVLVL